MIEAHRSINGNADFETTFFDMSPRIGRHFSAVSDGAKSLDCLTARGLGTERTSTCSYDFRCLTNEKRKVVYCQQSPERRLTRDTLRVVQNEAPKQDSFVDGDYPHKPLSSSMSVESSSTASSSSCLSYPSEPPSILSTLEVTTPICQWDGCDCSTVSQASLLDHLHKVHVSSQTSSGRKRHFQCLWRGCRVYKQPSVSPIWLERHVLHHTEAKGKPFKCIFNPCALRFSTTELLERHVRRAHIITSEKCNVSKIPGSTDSLQQHSLPKMSNSECVNKSQNMTNRRNCKRKRKQRYYRVRRVDFYDHRTQSLLHRRLAINRLLAESTCDLKPATNGHICTNHSNHLSACLDLPPALSLFNLNDLKSIPKALDASEAKCVGGFAYQERLHRIQQLLMVPHKYVGQRFSEVHNIEILVKWTGDSSSSCPQVAWIPEHEIHAAQCLDSLD